MRTKSILLSSFVTLAISCAGEPLQQEEAPDAPDNLDVPLRPAILWRAGCSNCTVSTPGNTIPPSEVLAAESLRFALQEVEIQGELETGFSIVMPEAPPANVMNTFFRAPTGALVLTQLPGVTQGLRPNPAVVDVFPLLLGSEREALRIASVAPIYIAFADEADRLNDGNVSDGYLDAGFHVARHDGFTVNAWLDRRFCRNVDPSECNNNPMPLDFVEVALDRYMTFEPGSGEDLVGALDNVNLAEFLSQ